MAVQALKSRNVMTASYPGIPGEEAVAARKPPLPPLPMPDGGRGIMESFAKLVGGMRPPPPPVFAAPASPAVVTNRGDDSTAPMIAGLAAGALGGAMLTDGSKSTGDGDAGATASADEKAEAPATKTDEGTEKAKIETPAPEAKPAQEESPAPAAQPDVIISEAEMGLSGPKEANVVWSK